MSLLFLSALLFADVQTARTLIQKGQIAEAVREIDAALRDHPNDPEIQFEAGQLLRELGADRASRLQQLAPDSPEAHELLGRSLESRGKLDDALIEYRAALRGRERTPGVHIAIGNVLWKQRDFEAAVPELEAELRLNPNHGFANLRLGQTLVSLDRPEKAVEHLRNAGSSVEAHQALGKAYRALGKHRDALEQFRTVALARPNDDSVHAQLAGEYRALGDIPQAKAELEIQRKLLQVKAAASRKAQP